MRNEPNLGQSQIFVTLMKTMNYSEKMKLDTWSKRTQTNPILKDGFLRIILQFWAVTGKIIGLLKQFPWKGVTRMVVLAGIDEAGFGAILGPLVVSSSAFSLPNHFLTADLWQILRKSVGSTRKHLAGRLLVTDRKKAYSKQKGIGHLQRTVLACLECLGKKPATLTELLTLLSPDRCFRVSLTLF